MRRALLFLAACGGNAPRDLHVVAWSPQGTIDRAEPVAIRFDRSVVDEGAIGQSVPPTSVVIAPAIAWRGTWRDDRTLVVEPLSPLHASTRYRVMLAGDLRARAGALALEFVHQPLVVEGIWGADASALAPDGDVPLSFDQPVDPQEAAAHCKLAGDSGEIALVASANEPAQDLALHPTRALAPGAAYTLSCAELAGAGGNAPLDRPYTLAVRARPALAVAGVLPAGEAVPPDGATIAIALTTPVTLDAIRDAVTASPAIPGLDRGALSADGMTYVVSTELASETEYRIAIAPFSDRFGQPLVQPIEARFRTAAAAPRLVAPRAAAGAFAVWTRDVDTFDVACDGAVQHRAAIADHRWHASEIAACERPIDLHAPGLPIARVTRPMPAAAPVAASEHVAVRQPNAFSLVARAKTSAPRPGGRLAFELEARAPSGMPLAGARIDWTIVRRARGAAVSGFEDFTFADSIADAPIADGTGTTDARGRLAIAAHDASPVDAAVDYVLVATAYDAAGGAADTMLALAADPAGFELGLRAGIAQASDATLPIALVAIAPDGSAVAAAAHLSIERIERTCDVLEFAGHDFTRCDEHRASVVDRDVVLANGAAREDRVELAPGTYVVRASAIDDAGHRIAVTRELAVLTRTNG